MPLSTMTPQYRQSLKLHVFWGVMLHHWVFPNISKNTVPSPSWWNICSHPSNDTMSHPRRLAIFSSTPVRNSNVTVSETLDVNTFTWLISWEHFTVHSDCESFKLYTTDSLLGIQSESLCHYTHKHMDFPSNTAIATQLHVLVHLQDQHRLSNKNFLKRKKFIQSIHFICFCQILKITKN
jgi:hypothetical protein